MKKGMDTIGRIISDTRKLKGLTQEELSELSNVNLRTIQ
jgi:transcriptional regulator with XRE-family HTH domain